MTKDELKCTIVGAVLTCYLVAYSWGYFVLHKLIN